MMLFLVLLQIPIDIMEGITDAKAREMAANLEFKGASLDDVRQNDCPLCC